LARTKQPAGGGPSSGDLGIHAGSTQKEILRGLLDALSDDATRVALFVPRAGAATGWQARGLGDDDGIKDFHLNMSGGPAAHADQKSRG